jgi:sigma-B regulation protein RsbU (phosphoserine phosphatase)
VTLLRRKNRYLSYISAVRNQEREAVLTFLNRIGEAFTRDINLDETLSMIGEFIIEESEAESGAIYLFEEDGEHLSARVVVGLFPPLHETLSFVTTKKKYLQQKVKSERIKKGESIVGLAAETGKSYLIEDATKDERVPSANHSVVPMKSLMVAPLRVRGKVLGVMAVLNKTMGETFNSHDMSLLQALADQAAVTVNIVSLYGEIAEKQRIEQELSLARDFQRLLLPKDDPELKGYDFTGISTPALEVGGDYYDYIPIDDDHLGFCVADVSGKGIPGGLVMAAARSALQAEARLNLSPKEVLLALNDRMVEDTGENVFITMTYGVLTISTGEICFARAGHEPTLILDQADNVPLENHTPDGIALGLVEREIFDITEEQTITLKEGQMFLLYTDGVIEAMNAKSEEYGFERFSDVLASNRQASSEEMVSAILEDIRDFSGGIHQHDDITILVIRRVNKAAASVEDISNDGSGDATNDQQDIAEDNPASKTGTSDA